MSDYLSAHYAQSALVIIDFQNDAVLPGGVMEIPGSFDILPQLVTLTKAMRRLGRPIVHVVRSYLPDGTNVDICRRSAIEEGFRILTPYSDGADFPAALKPDNAPSLDWSALLGGHIQAIGENDWVLYKSRWGAFYRTNLETFLRTQGVDTLIFGGCNFPNCPRTTIYEASERDFRLVVAIDAISGIYPQGITELKNIGVTLANTADISQALKEHEA